MNLQYDRHGISDYLEQFLHQLFQVLLVWIMAEETHPRLNPAE
jgi:hypothetical protein